MPLKSKKSPPKKKPAPKAKAKKPILKSVKVASPLPQQSSILWKILAERERRQQNAPPKQGLSNHRGTQYPQQHGKHEQFARFAGPRRRAA